MDLVSDVDFSGMNFMFNKERGFEAGQIMDLAKRYHYSPAEKLNLFLSVLRRNISEAELLKLFKAWDMKSNPALRVGDYRHYLKDFWSIYTLIQRTTDNPFYLCLIKKILSSPLFYMSPLRPTELRCLMPF